MGVQVGGGGVSVMTKPLTVKIISGPATPDLGLHSNYNHHIHCFTSSTTFWSPNFGVYAINHTRP